MPRLRTIALLIICAALIGAAVLVFSVMHTSSQSSAVPAEFQSGQSFKPGASATVADSPTTAQLDGLKQEVRTTKATQQWRALFPDASCDGDVCTASAYGAAHETPSKQQSANPDSKSGDSSAASDDSSGNLLHSLFSHGIGTAVTSLLILAALAYVGYDLIWGEDSK